MKKVNISKTTSQIVGVAMFAALAFGVTFVFRIPVLFLTFDAKDAVITIASFIYGPLSGAATSLIVAALELASGISGTGLYGFVMNFASSAMFSCTASLIYKYRRSYRGAIVGLYSAAVLNTAWMMLLNILITPFYMGVDLSAVISMIPSVLLPFNLAKALMNTAITIFLYKPVTVALRRTGLISAGPSNAKFGRASVVMIVSGALALAVAITVFILIK